MSKIKVVLDAITTDGNLDKVVEGAIKVVNEIDDLMLYLVGPKDDIQTILKQFNFNNNNNLEIIDAQDKITNLDNPMKAIRQKTRNF